MDGGKTQGLLLEAREYRETSLLVTLLLENQGKTQAIAKGARRARSSLAGVLQPFARLALRLDQKKPGGLANLYEADLIHRPRYAQGAGPDAMTRLAYAAIVAEVLAAGEENDPHGAELFHLAVDFFEGLEKAPHPGSFSIAGLWALTTALGFAPEVPEKPPAGQKRFFDLWEGTICAQAKAPGKREIPLEHEEYVNLSQMLNATIKGRWQEGPVLNRKNGRAQSRLLLRFLETQIDRPLRSRRFLEEMIL